MEKKTQTIKKNEYVNLEKKTQRNIKLKKTNKQTKTETQTKKQNADNNKKENGSNQEKREGPELQDCVPQNQKPPCFAVVAEQSHILSLKSK